MFLRRKKRPKRKNSISDVGEMPEVVDVEAEYCNGSVSDPLLDTFFNLPPALQNEEQYETFDSDYYDTTKVVFVEDEDEGWRDHMFGDVVNNPFAFEDPPTEKLETVVGEESDGLAEGTAPWALLEGESEDSPYFVTPCHHPLLEHDYSEYYFFVDSARKWVLASPEEVTRIEKSTTDVIATSKDNLSKVQEMVLEEESTPGNFISEEISFEETEEDIDVVTVEEDGVNEVTSPEAGSIKNHGHAEKFICKVPLSEVKLKNRGRDVESEEADSIVENRWKEEQKRSSLLPEVTSPGTDSSKNHGEGEKLICRTPSSQSKLKYRSRGTKMQDPDTRTEINLREKRRRASLKQGFEEVRKRIPSLRSLPRATTICILKYSREYVEYLKTEQKKLLRQLQKEMTAREKVISSIKEHAI